MKNKRNFLLITLVMMLLLSNIYLILNSKEKIDNLEAKFIDVSSSDDSVTQLSEDINTIKDDLSSSTENEKLHEEKLERLTQDYKDEIKDLKKEIELIKEGMNAVSFDESFQVKKMVNEWLDYMHHEMPPSGYEMDVIKDLFGVSSNFYYSDYPKFEETGEIMYEMVNKIFQPYELIIVERTGINNPFYQVWDLDGNNYRIWYDGESIYSIWIYAAVCNNLVDDFLELVEAGDIDGLVPFFYYEAYGSSWEEQVGYIKRNIMDRLPGKNVKAELIAIDNLFIYEITDDQGNEIQIAVNCDSETFAHILPYDQSFEPLSY